MFTDGLLDMYEACSTINLTIEACSPAEALPTLDAFVKHLEEYGQANHHGSAVVYYKFPNSVIAQIEFFPRYPLRRTMEEMIESLHAPDADPIENRHFSWDERQSGQRMHAFPQITWISIHFPHAVFAQENQRKNHSYLSGGDVLNCANDDSTDDDRKQNPLADSSSLINLAIDVSTIAEALPTLEAFVRHLGTFGRASYHESAKIYEEIPYTIIASIHFYPYEPLKETMDTMIASLEIPEVVTADLPRFTWDERNTKRRMSAFPKIAWLSLLYPNAVCERGNTELAKGPLKDQYLFAVMYLAVEAGSAEEALPTLVAMESYLEQFGAAKYDRRARVCDTMPNTMIAKIVMFLSPPLRRSMERMIASFQFPGGTCQERAAFSWSERNTKKRMSAFPQITWLYIELPYIVYEG